MVKSKRGTFSGIRKSVACTGYADASVASATKETYDLHDNELIKFYNKYNSFAEKAYIEIISIKKILDDYISFEEFIDKFIS